MEKKLLKICTKRKNQYRYEILYVLRITIIKTIKKLMREKNNNNNKRKKIMIKEKK